MLTFLSRVESTPSRLYTLYLDKNENNFGMSFYLMINAMIILDISVYHITQATAPTIRWLDMQVFASI